MSTATPTPFDTALDEALATEDAVESTEEISADEAAEAELELDETAEAEEEKEGETPSDAEAAAAEVEEEELDLGEPADEDKEEHKEEKGEEGDLEEELSQDEDIKPDREDEKEYHYKKAKAIRLMREHADMKKIREEIPNANVDVLKQHYEDHTTLNRMLEDFDSGFDGMGRVLNYLLGNPEKPETVKAVNPQTARVLAASIPAHLQNTHPQALGELENIIFDAKVKQLYRNAEALEREGADKGKVEQAFALAENFELNVFKKLSKRGTASSQGEDHGETAALKQEIANLRKVEESRQGEIYRQRVTAIEGAVQDADKEEIDLWLGKVKAKGAKFSEREERHIRRDLQEAIDSAVEGNTAWRRQFDTQRDAATRKFSEESRDRLKAQRRQFVAQHVRRNLKSVVTDNTRSQVAASKVAHEKQAATQARRQAPPSGERTSRKINVGKAFKEGKMTYDDLVDKLV